MVWAAKLTLSSCVEVRTYLRSSQDIDCYHGVVGQESQELHLITSTCTKVSNITKNKFYNFTAKYRRTKKDCCQCRVIQSSALQLHEWRAS